MRKKASTNRELPGERTATAGAATVVCKKVMAMRHKDKRPIMIARCEGDRWGVIGLLSVALIQGVLLYRRELDYQTHLGTHSLKISSCVLFA
jgi:hypothetical protein